MAGVHFALDPAEVGSEALTARIAADPSKLALLKNLTGKLVQYNGKIVNPSGSHEKGFWAQLSTKPPLQLRIRDDMLDMLDNYDFLCRRMKFEMAKTYDSNTGPKEAHGSVRDAVSRVASHLRDAVMVLMTPEQKAQGRAYFTQRLNEVIFSFDEDQNGLVTKPEFANALRLQGLELSTMDLMLVWEAFDRDKDGVIDTREFSDFICAASGGSYRRSSILIGQKIHLDNETGRMRAVRISEKVPTLPLVRLHLSECASVHFLTAQRVHISVVNLRKDEDHGAARTAGGLSQGAGALVRRRGNRPAEALH
jgi:hypothetical protein